MWPFERSNKAEAQATETLKSAGYKGSFRRMRILAHSPADEASNNRLHAVTNRMLLKTLMDDHVGDCIHITGKMNALADPFHRRLCAEVAKHGKTRFSVVYDGPVAGERDEKALAAKSARRWAHAGWSDKLAAVSLIGEEFVDLWSGPTREMIQYTVFGSRYTQLQGRHSEEPGTSSSTKLIWLIDSEEINGFLTETGKATLAASRDVNEAAFRDFFIQVTGVEAHDLLATLFRGGPANRTVLVTPRLLDFNAAAGDILDGLEAIGFVRRDEADSFYISDQGRQFISLAP